MTGLPTVPSVVHSTTFTAPQGTEPKRSASFAKVCCGNLLMFSDENLRVVQIHRQQDEEDLLQNQTLWIVIILRAQLKL
jgi:hypothetical protein